MLPRRTCVHIPVLLAVNVVSIYVHDRRCYARKMSAQTFHDSTLVHNTHTGILFPYDTFVSSYIELIRFTKDG
jgi:hypothetical protein